MANKYTQSKVKSTHNGTINGKKGQAQARRESEQHRQQSREKHSDVYSPEVRLRRLEGLGFGACREAKRLQSFVQN